jgi:hypothetical protein
LVEFKETVLPKSSQNVSVADSLYKLEASRDIRTIKLPKFSGNALFYADFIGRFKIHIHDKPHLTDDMPMIQLKMHVTGDFKCQVPKSRRTRDFGTWVKKGVMYATAKNYSSFFGTSTYQGRQDSTQRYRRALRELSIDVVNCVATMHQVKYFADVNASDNLRKIVMRLPDYLVQKWKGVVIDIREKQRSPTTEDISTFLRKQVKAEFDPDFGDMSLKPPKYDSRNGETIERQGINAAQRNERSKALKCYVCNEDHKVIECPALADSIVPERFNLVREARLCFSCLNKGHVTRDCRSKKKCEKNNE